MSKPKKIIFIVQISILIIILLNTQAAAQTTDDLIFIHHSCGSNWLGNSLNAALLAKSYIDERNDITYGTSMSADAGRPTSLGGSPGDNTNMDHWIRWFNDYLSGIKSHGCADGVNKIIMFKSCYPISNIGSDGEEPGDPFSSTQTITNYKSVYRHPDGAGNSYSEGGYTYYPLEDIFAANSNTLFIAVTAPPRHYAGTDDDDAHRARTFNNWLKNDWLNDYNAAHPGLDNVAVFDWFEVLAYADDHGSHPNRLKSEYGGESSDSHPNSTANSASTVVFASGGSNFIDTVWNDFSTNSVLVKVEIFLEGSYGNGTDLMTTDLNSGGYIPLISPYTEDVRTVSSIPVNAVDWMLIELRSTKTGSAVVSRSCFLQNDGKIISDNGEADYIAMDAADDNYFLVINHRNHLTVMSDETHLLSTGSSTTYDFATGEDKYEGADAALLETGVYGMYAGDGNESGIVTISDANLAITNRDAVGYEMSDYNLSGIVTVSDANQAITNRDAHTNVE